MIARVRCVDLFESSGYTGTARDTGLTDNANAVLGVEAAHTVARVVIAPDYRADTIATAIAPHHGFTERIVANDAGRREGGRDPPDRISTRAGGENARTDTRLIHINGTRSVTRV